MEDIDCPQAVGGPIVKVVGRRDLTGDGVPDVLLRSECEASTSSWPQWLSVYDGAAGSAHPRRLQRLLTDRERPSAYGLRELEVAELTARNLMVTSLGYRKNDSFCCPSLAIIDTWSWDGQRYVRHRRDVAPLGVGD